MKSCGEIFGAKNQPINLPLSNQRFDDMMTANVVPVATNNNPQLAGGALAPLVFKLMHQEKK